MEDFAKNHRRKDRGDDPSGEARASMRDLRKVVRVILKEDCPQPEPPKTPAVKSAVASELGRAPHHQDTPGIVSRLARAALPLATVVSDAWEVLELKLRPHGSINLETRLEAAGSKETPLLKPGPKALESDKHKLFTAFRPPISGYKPSFYKLHDSTIEIERAKAEEAVASIMGSKKPSATVPFKDLELQETLAKQSSAVASHQDWALASLSRYLKNKGWTDSTTDLLVGSLGDANSHQAQFATRLAANSILLRRDAVLKRRPDLDGGVVAALRAVDIGSRTLFNDQLPQGLAVDQRLAGLDMKAPKRGDSKKKTSKSKHAPRRDRGKPGKSWGNSSGRQPRRGGSQAPGPSFSRASRGRSFRSRGGGKGTE